MLCFVKFNKSFLAFLFTTESRAGNQNWHLLMAASSSTLAPPSIPVVFSTKTQYELPPQKFMIPASWRRFQLSQLINTALALPHVVPFDFLIHGALLRGSLSEAADGEVSRACELTKDT
jgi:NLE (NUC135) domain